MSEGRSKLASMPSGRLISAPYNAVRNESTEVHNPRRDCAILTLAHETHQTFTV